MYGCNLQKRAMHIAGHNQQQLNKKAYNLIVLQDKTHPHTVDGVIHGKTGFFSCLPTKR